jgi:hypothetical protein
MALYPRIHKWRVPPQVAELEKRLAEQIESAEARRAREVLPPSERSVHKYVYVYIYIYIYKMYIL